MGKYKTFYRRNLPHFQPSGETFFVTFRLDGSLPINVIEEIKEERLKAIKEIAGYDNTHVRKEKYKVCQSKYFGKFDKLLDGAGYGPTWLTDHRAAQVVKDAMHYYDKKTYELICYTIMSNHVHVVFTPLIKSPDRTVKNTREDRNGVSNYKSADQYSLMKDGKRDVCVRNGVSNYIVTKILQDLKRYTAGKCNKVLNRTGTFWQHESYDHVIRDYNELIRIVKYVMNNPVKAGLCEKWEDWRWSYCNLELLG